MSIPYNLNIPLSSHNPSVDQPNMETNNNSIASIIAVDHVAFNTSGSGQHNQVTFNATNVPAVPTAPPVLFTNTQDGFGTNLPGPLAQLFYYSGDAAHGQQQYKINGTSGSVLLPMGIILKWVQQSGVATTGGTLNTFASAGLPDFPNNLFTVIVTNTLTGTLHSIAITTWAKTGFTARSDSSSVGFGYLAIGN